MHINLQNEGNKCLIILMLFLDPEITDPNNLKPIAGRKLWKIMHKKSLKSKSENRRDKKVKKLEKM